jgi:signal transduction histidine kinase/ActR/RegA family two-component response regulator
MQIGTVIMVSFVSYLVLHFSAIRHILMIAGYMRRYGPDRETSELVLSRSPAFSPAGGDELDELTAAINDLRRRLNRAYENLSRELELRRTAESELKVAYSESQDHVRRQTEELRLANRLLSSQVSELQETRDRLKVARDEEADLSRAKTEFLATLGHEVRTPIAGIIGVVRLLTNRDDTDSIRSYLEMILSSAVDLHRIVDDIVEYSRYENEDPVLKRAPFSIRDAVRDSAELYEYQASANQSVISVSVSPDLPDAVVGDGERLRQILRNLINNAVKFTRGGEVKVVAFAQHRGETVLRIEFRVEDTGVGIPKDKMERLFSPYYQVEGTDHTHGSGLGLAISKQLAEYMDGSIVAESEPGKGSVFIVVLPFGLPGTDSTVTRTETGAGDAKHPGRTILVAEDNGINRYYLRELLSALGYRILEAADGKQAVEVALSEHPDLILMDVEMPEVDGIEATQRIRGQELGPATPIVALSAHEVTDLSERVAGVGIDAVLGKPIDEQRLFDTVDDLISRRTAKPGRPGKSSNHPVDTPPKT